PAGLRRHRLEDGEMLRAAGEELAPEREGILARGVRELVDEALEIEGVLVVVDAAPEARRHRWIAHRVVDEEVLHAVAENALRAARVEALEGRRIAAVLQALRIEAGKDRLAGDAHVQPDEIAVRIEAADEPAHGHRMVAAMQHVLFPAPDQLHRSA